MKVQTGVSASSVLRGANHVVFVEGSNDDAFDPTVIRELLRSNGLNSVEVRAVGPCDNVFHAAKAMVWKHPTYYFLADRDGHEADYVERGWINFPRTDTYNFIHWRKRELENYFIDPLYIEKSAWLVKTPVEIQDKILIEANRRLYIEVANLVLLKIRSEILTPPRVWFRQLADFSSRTNALAQLQSAAGLAERKTEIDTMLSAQKREQLFDSILLELSGGKPALEYGSGTWLERISGKEIFRTISGELFRVRDAAGNVLNGQEQNNEVAKGLLKLPLAEQPADFRELIRLLQAKVNGTP